MSRWGISRAQPTRALKAPRHVGLVVACTLQAALRGSGDSLMCEMFSTDPGFSWQLF